MKKNKIAFALLTLFLCLTISGCDTGNDIEADPTVNGNYQDTITLSNGATADFQVTLNEKNGKLSGDGKITNSNASAALKVDGTHDHPNISLTFTSSGYYDFNLSGTVSDNGNRINGMLTGSGLDDVNVSLVRQ